MATPKCSFQPMVPSMGSLGFHPPGERFMGVSPGELWVGFVEDVPLVGTSANMVDGFIALLQGDLKTAEAKGYKDFLDAAEIRDLKAGSILQNDESQVVIGCSAEVSKAITDYIIQAVGKKPRSAGEIKAAKAAQEGADLSRRLCESFEALRCKLKQRGVNLERDVVQNRRSGRGEHVFNNALLKVYRGIVESFINKHTRGSDRDTLVGRIPNSQVSDAFQANASDGVHINLTADQRRNIRTWVVHISNNVVYIPVNNTLFAHLTSVIENKAVAYMHQLALGKSKGDESNKNMLACAIEWMNSHRVYLDPQAVEIWFAKNSNLIEEFHRTEAGVQQMLLYLDPQRSHTLCKFVEDLRRAGADFK
ncbi:hypothetical protein GJAV_G00067130 [Gymnothorax javanicus]|nr:hypothetical protein GJAV_G00067130 [Gymnothorax javanicus]